MSKISHSLLKNPVVVTTGTKLSEAAQLMKKNKVEKRKNDENTFP